MVIHVTFPIFFSIARAHHLSSSQRTTLLKWNIRVSLHQLHPERTHYRNKWNNDHSRVSIIPRSTPVHDSNATGSHSLQKKTLPNRLGRIEECSINPYLEGHRVSSLEKVEENSAIQFRCSGEIAISSGRKRLGKVWLKDSWQVCEHFTCGFTDSD